MEHKEKTKKVSPESATPAPVVTQSTPVVVSKPKKKRWGIRILAWLFVLCVFATGFVIVGVYVSKQVIPQVETWLVDHQFMNASDLDNGIVPNQNETKSTNELTVPEVVKRASSSVVSIAVVGTDTLQNGVQESSKIGTGFIVDNAGIIVTNQHVVSDLKAEYQVVTSDNKTYKPKSIIRDEVNDIALIIVDAKGLPALSIGDSEKIEVGQSVIAIGTPLGEFPGSVTSGIISGVGRTVKTGGGFWEVQKEYDNVLQTDAAINPGNSGGPLLNLFGEVVGVNFATTGGADNISFALPINAVSAKISEYKQYGKFRSAYLGVGYRMVLAQEAEFYNVQPGALIRNIADNSPAKTAGIKVGDIVTKVNDKAIASTLAATLGKYKVGDTITLTIVRSDIQGKSETLTFKVTLAEKPAAD